MRSLVSLLQGAVQRGASEVTLESGQPVVYKTARGDVAESMVLPRTELFDMIVAAVDDAQQVELAVGNPVRFSVEAEADWSVYAEPGALGITVHAQREVDELEIGLARAGDGGSWMGPPDVPAHTGAGFGFELDEPQFDVSLSPAPKRPRPPNAAPPSQLYVEALDVPEVDDSITNAPIDAHAGAPFESGTWALDDEDEFEIGLDEPPDPSQLPTGLGTGAPHIGVPADDDDDDKFIDPFEDSGPLPLPSDTRRISHSPTVRAMDASAVPSPPTPTDAAEDGAPQRRARDISDRLTVRDIGVVVPSDINTQRDLPNITRAGAAQAPLIAEIAEGSLVFVREPGYAESLAASVQAPTFIITDPYDPHEVWTRVRALPPASIIVVRCEDPSVLLDGILRRLEEGYRVFVETRARTVEGARRVLLGVSASERAERWLNAQLTLTIEPGEGGPRLVEA